MNRRFALSMTALTAALAGLYLAWGSARIETHYLLSQLNHGVSSGKILFLLAFVAAVMLRAALRKKPKANRRLGYAMLIAGALFGLAGSMTAHLHYVHTHDLNLSTPTFHGRDGHLSVNSTAHIHVSKTAIAHSIDALGLDGWHDRFDTGSVYRSAVPAWLSAIIGLGFLLTTVMVVLLAPGAASRYGPYRRQACVLLWALAGCALCKCILDGGPLAYDAVVAGVCLLLIAGGVSRVRMSLCVVGFISWLIVIFAIDPDLVPTQLGRALQRGAIYLLILLFGIWLAYPKRPPRGVRLATAATAAVVGAFVTLGWTRYVSPLRAPSPSSAIVYTLDPVDGLTATTIPADAQAVTVAALYQQVGEDPMRPRSTSVAPRPAGYSYDILGELTLLKTTGDALSFKASDVAEMRRARSHSGYAGPGDRLQFVWRIDGGVGPVLAGGIHQLSQNERFVAYYLLDTMLRDAGVEQYILTPYLIEPIKDAPSGTPQGVDE